MVCRAAGILLLCIYSTSGYAQFNTDRLISSGRIALYYEDYVLSIQYLSQVIMLKPHLYEPWQLRSAAKFYLDDYSGAEQDATEAIKLNPYIASLYDLRGICRIRQKEYDSAIEDYTNAIRLDPNCRNYWFNRAVCRIEGKDYKRAANELDTLIRRWSTFPDPYNAMAEICLLEKDTTKADEWLGRSAKVDPYNVNTWSMRAGIAMSRKQWEGADSLLTRAIQLKPRSVNNYVNRALTRCNINNLRGAMSDYDIALDIDPNNFLAHYNRGLLRQQVGDDNRAIEDFNYVLKIEPDNIMAIFNRACLLDQTGDLRGAIRDYSKVIEQFPNFWTGLSRRASCYRRLGMTANAEKDEFRILKAQMDKHLGVQPRWSKGKLQDVRKKNDIDPNNYQQLVIDDQTPEREYQSEYRGKVQNRKVNIDFLPEQPITGFDPDDGKSMLQNYADITAGKSQGMKATQQTVSDLNEMISKKPGMAGLYYTRGTLFAKQGNYSDAITDFTQALVIDPLMPEAYFNRGLAYIFSNEKKKGLQDLSKAGELGLYSAYSVMKKFNSEKKN